MKESKLLVLFVDKENGKYDHFEVYPECVRNDIDFQIAEWNKTQKTTAKFYDDPLLSDFVADVTGRWRSNEFINSMKDVQKSIQYNIEELGYWQDKIDDIVRDFERINENEKEVF